MTTPNDLPRLNPTELSVMNVLWDADALSAREIHDRIADEQGWAYSTTRTNLERMVRKDLLEKSPFHGLHLYKARISRPIGLARLVREFAAQVLGANPIPVVALFSGGDRLDDDEIAELRRLVEQDEKEEAAGDAS